ncbi:ABC transporter transmembrane domain-containing protein [Pseudomonas sp. 10S4]|uniref:ABC transporter transmembrane domain-containing protein n=1 Tax=Pseudomonas sp. 10S4 TaxID=3048583 RepID=UPI003A0FC464
MVGKLVQPYVTSALDIFEKRQLGDIAARFQSFAVIRKILTNGAITGVLDGLVAIATLTMMLLYSRALTAIVLIALVLYGVARLVFTTRSATLLRSA